MIFNRIAQILKARALFRILESRYYGIKWPSKKLSILNFINYTLRRINEASGPYQMFGQLVDVISINELLFIMFLTSSKFLKM